MPRERCCVCDKLPEDKFVTMHDKTVCAMCVAELAAELGFDIIEPIETIRQRLGIFARGGRVDSGSAAAGLTSVILRHKRQN